MVRFLWVEILAAGTPRSCQRVLSLSHARQCVVMVVMAPVASLAVVTAPVVPLVEAMVHQEAEGQIPPEAVPVRMVPTLSITPFAEMTGLGWHG